MTSFYGLTHAPLPSFEETPANALVRVLPRVPVIAENHKRTEHA
jgi:hypothetical protein